MPVLHARQLPLLRAIYRYEYTRVYLEYTGIVLLVWLVIDRSQATLRSASGFLPVNITWAVSLPADSCRKGRLFHLFDERYIIMVHINSINVLIDCHRWHLYY